jgi:hypothetical protein
MHRLRADAVVDGGLEAGGTGVDHGTVRSLQREIDRLRDASEDGDREFDVRVQIVDVLFGKIPIYLGKTSERYRIASRRPFSG